LTSDIWPLLDDAGFGEDEVFADADRFGIGRLDANLQVADSGDVEVQVLRIGLPTEVAGEQLATVAGDRGDHARVHSRTAGRAAINADDRLQPAIVAVQAVFQS